MAYIRGSGTKATRSYVPVIYSKTFVAKLDKTCCALQCVNRDWESEISKAGDLVTIPEAPDSITINDYSFYSTITYQLTTESSQDLVIDQQKYWAYKIDYIDIQQAQVELIQMNAERAAISMRNTVDTHLMTAMSAGVAASNIMGATTAGSVIQLTSENILPVFTDLMTILDDADVFGTTDDQPWAICNPAVLGLMKKARMLDQTPAGDEARSSGYVGDFAGFKVMKSTNIALNAASGGTDDNFSILVGVNFAHTFALQIYQPEEIEPLQTTFGKGRRALALYGSKTVRPKALAKLIAKV